MTPLEQQIIKGVLAIVWIVTGILSLGIYPVTDSLVLLERVGFYGTLALWVLYLAAGLDIVVGILTLTTPSKTLWQLQAAIILGYTAVITVCLPEFWLHPFGPILKNLPLLAMLWLLHNQDV